MTRMNYSLNHSRDMSARASDRFDDSGYRNAGKRGKAKKRKKSKRQEGPAVPVPETSRSPVPGSNSRARRRARRSAERSLGPSAGETKILHLSGVVPPDVWRRFGTKILPKLRSASDLTVSVQLSATVSVAGTNSLITDLRQILHELGLADTVTLQ